MNSTSHPSGTGRLRTIAIFSGASLAAVASGAVTLAASGMPPGSWARNPVAWCVGLALGAGLMLLRSSLLLARAILGVALLGVGATFLAPAQEGVHRWVDLGPLHINVAALLLPVAVIALAHGGISSRIGLAFAAAMAALLVLQPDASQATSFLVAVIILVAVSPAPRRGVMATAAALLAAVSWSRPDPIQPVAEVEGVFPLAWAVSPLLATAAALALATTSLSPLAFGKTAGASQRAAAFALSGYLICAAVCPALGAFPVPLVGLGMSFPVGYWLAIALLCARHRGAQNDVPAAAIQRL